MILKKNLLIIILLTVVLITPKIEYATEATSNCPTGGAWCSSATWNPAIVPGCVDTITIRLGYPVIITSTVDLISCGSIYIFIDDTLRFQTGKKLKLAEGSVVYLSSTGYIEPGGGGGSSNYLEIGGNEVWNAGDGAQSGPMSFTSGGPLPIELINFEANVDEDKVALKWITASEINNDYFTIERSADAKIWKNVLTTNGAGNSNQILEYFEKDYQPLKGISYYRLKQTDFNGEFSYSNIVPVKYNNSSNNNNLNLFPSPITVGETLHIEFKNIFEDELLVVLRDIKGSEYYSKVIVNIEDGKLIGVPIDMNIPSGVYLITATSENQMYCQKLIIK